MEAMLRSISQSMKLQFICLLLSVLSGCSLIGAKIGQKVDDSAFGDAENKHKYEAQYMVEGLEEDIAIIQAILAGPESEYVDPDPCKDENSIQVCTVKKGCWCEVRKR
ncbi:MAG: hypothetical protein MI756_20075 [Chromatiales bacterium]|nr:hypothetical protein [Chromatiales bacterium]